MFKQLPMSFATLYKRGRRAGYFDKRLSEQSQQHQNVAIGLLPADNKYGYSSNSRRENKQIFMYLLRSFVLLAMLVIGAEGAWGVSIKKTVSLPTAGNDKGTWDSGTKTMGWTASTSNLLTLSDLDNCDLSKYDRIKLVTSDLTTGPFRCVITTSEGDFTWVMNSAGTKDLILNPNLIKTTDTQGFKNGSNIITLEQLRNVTSVKIGGHSGEGSIKVTEIYLVKELDWDTNGQIRVTPEYLNCNGTSISGNTITQWSQYFDVNILFDTPWDIKSEVSEVTVNETHTPSGAEFIKWYVPTSGDNVTSINSLTNDVNKFMFTLNSNTSDVSVNLTDIVFTSKNRRIVSFDTDGGSAIDNIAYSGSPIKLPTPTKSGQAFVGWFLHEQNGGQTVNTFVGYPGADYTPTSDVTLYAHWAPETEQSGTIGSWDNYVDVNKCFSKDYTVTKNTQAEFTFKNNRNNNFTEKWYNWSMWATAGGRTSKTGNYFFLNLAPCVRKTVSSISDDIWKNNETTHIYISNDGKLTELTTSSQWDTFLNDMYSADVNVKVSYYNNTIRMYAVMQANGRKYVYPYVYENSATINDADNITVYFSVDHTIITDFTSHEAKTIIPASYNNPNPTYGNVRMYTEEGLLVESGTQFALGDKIIYEAIPNIGYEFSAWGGSGNTDNPRTVTISQDNIAQGNCTPGVTFIADTGHRTITVDGNQREYYIYVPESAKNKLNVPVVFSLHGRGNNADPFTMNAEGTALKDTGKPVYTDLANDNGFIVVYPQGRNAGGSYTGFEPGWDTGFAGGNGWEATGKENGDTRFIKALVEKIQSDYATQTTENGNISVDKNKFYMSGFSMGGMMTYAFANVHPDIFAAYGVTGGLPLNEFHLQTANINRSPFVHIHAKDDGYVAFVNLECIKENMAARYGHNIHVEAVRQAERPYDVYTLSSNTSTGVLEYYEIDESKNVGHSVTWYAPNILWDFFKGKSYSKTNTTLEYKWNLDDIHSHLSESPISVHGWDIDSPNHKMTYGGKSNVKCTTAGCNGGEHASCNGNHNVYNSVQLPIGSHVLYATATVNKSASEDGIVYVTIKNNRTGREIVSRKLVNNEGVADAQMNIVFPFVTSTEDEFTIIVGRSADVSSVTLLEIHDGTFTTSVSDQSLDNSITDTETGLVAKIDFEDVTTSNLNILTTGNALTETLNADSGHKYFMKNRDKTIEESNKSEAMKYFIVQDKVFGHYFQNMPKANIYERTAEQDYIRVVLNADEKAKLENIKNTGEVTIGFWVNAAIAVENGLAYNNPSIFYMASDKPYGYVGPNPDETSGTYNDYMFNITGAGGISGHRVLDGGTAHYAGGQAFGSFCPTTQSEATNTLGNFYAANFYIDKNWHYITYQMFNNFSRYNMYVDGKPAKLNINTPADNTSILKNGVEGLNSIVLGGLNARNCSFSCDVAFAYDDIVIYDRLLTQADINKIIADKHYSLGSWDFKESLKIIPQIVDPSRLSAEYWTNNGNNTYTLNKNFTSAAALTYDGVNTITAFDGLEFITDGADKITFDTTNGRLTLNGGVKIVFKNTPKDEYIRIETDQAGLDWDLSSKENIQFVLGLTGNKVALKAGGPNENYNDCMITVPSGGVSISKMAVYGTSYAVLEWKKDGNIVTKLVNPTQEQLPSLDVIINAVSRNESAEYETGKTFWSLRRFTSSAPQVASIDNLTGAVTLTGVAGSTVITAELLNDNLFDTDHTAEDLYEHTSHIFAKYEIVVEPKAENTYVVDADSYDVGQKITSSNEKIQVTLGGWSKDYNSGVYYGNTDAYTGKQEWAGNKYEKGANATKYNDDSRLSEENVFEEIFKGETPKSISTNGSYAAKSEQLTTDNTSGYHASNKDNISYENETPWTLPCRGSYIKIEPIAPGLISAYVMQEGCVSFSDGTNVGTGTSDTYLADEPYDIKVRRVYVADETGKIIKDVVTETKSKVAAQIWNNDGRARAEYNYAPGSQELAYNLGMYNAYAKFDWGIRWDFLDNWPNRGMKQHAFLVKNGGTGTEGSTEQGKDGHVIINKGVVRYTFNVLPGKTYYIFSNDAKLGFAGFTFDEGKKMAVENVEIKADKYSELRARSVNPLSDYPALVDVELSDGTNFSETANNNAVNAKITLNRPFVTNYWNGICVPYSINRRQIEEIFGDGTMVVLMDKINTNTKHAHFIQHINQDIIAGYPYFIFPTKKNDEEKTEHVKIESITTYGTLGEVSSPLFTVGSDGHTYTTGGQKDELIFEGNFNNKQVYEGTYVMSTSTGLLTRMTKDMPMKPYRAYLSFNKSTPTSPAKAIMLSSIVFGNIDGDDIEHPTSIEELLFEDGILTRSSDVYNLSGQKVRSNASNLYGLPKGVYIVNGKRYINK